LVLRLAFLILLCLPVAANSSQETLNLCLSCHQGHHQEYGTCTDCHRGDPRSTRLNIAHFGLIQARHAWFNLPETSQVEQGTRQLKTYACRRCHVIGDTGNQLATNLDRSVAASDPLALIEAIRNPVLLMPDFHLTDFHLDLLINALFSLGQNVNVVTDEMPQIVHFEGRERMEENLFVKHCGGCHQALTATLGGLGDGIVAPNLSGLLTEFYPETAKDNTPWNRDNLKKWLKNPRDLRPLTPMMPVDLEDEELKQLLDLLDEDISLPQEKIP